MSNPYDDFGGGPQPRLAFPTLTPAVRTLLVTLAVCFAVQYVISWRPAGRIWVVEILGLAPATWSEWLPWFAPVWQPVTYAFLHDTGRGAPMHLLYNLLLLYFFGTMLEGILGSRRFLVLYLACALAGALLHLCFEPLLGPGLPAIGASGAVLGVMIAVATLRPNTLVILLVVPVRLKWLAIGVVAIDVFGLLGQLRDGVGDMVAHWVHLGGAAFGFAAARRGWVWLDPIQRLQAKRAIRAEERRAGDEERMDQLLVKIRREGMSSLSRSEREFLKRMSARR